MAKQKQNGSDAVAQALEHLVEAVDRTFPEEFTAGVSVHSVLDLEIEDTDCFETGEGKAAASEYDRLFKEIQAALPIDKKHLALSLDKAVGGRLCHEELVPLTVGLIAGMRTAGMSRQKTAMMAKQRLASMIE